jgi:hypothetical protein
MPVNVLPKTSSSSGKSSLGVVVFVTDNAWGLMPGNWAMAASEDSILYGRCHVRGMNEVGRRCGLKPCKLDRAHLVLMIRAIDQVIDQDVAF